MNKKMQLYKILLCKKINATIIFLIQYLNKIHLNIIKKIGNSIIENPNKYESLVPINNADKNNEYSKMLKVALETPKNNNIAITGTYGSGKSSFLRTFEHKNKEWEYLHISLATFEDNNKKYLNEETPSKDITHPKVKTDEKDTPVNNNITEKNDPHVKKDKLNQLLEKSILQQIFYKEKEQTIPFSRFKRIKNIKSKELFQHAFLIGILFLYVISMFFAEKVNQFLMINLKHELLKYDLLPWVMLIVFIFYFYQIFQYLMRLQISKLNIKSGEIEVNKKDKTSILNEHLDEILYFFEVTQYKVVVIEDLDRFDNTEIFIKLREMNTLINNSKDINRRVVFIYAIKDNMFKDKDRTKFFDFIIPIIPYINSSSSFEKIKDKFKGEDLDQEFLRNLSLRIDDMRSLINIANEYKIYKYKIRSQKLNKNRLLAMIVYKNFYPSDFAKLHSNEGNVYNIFNKRTVFIKEELKKIEVLKNEKIQEINALEQKINLEKQKSIEELRMIYIAKICSKRQQISFHGKDGTIYNLTHIQNIITDSAFENIRNQQNHSFGYVFSNIEDEINQDLSYQEREKLIIEIPNRELEKLKKELEFLKNQEIKIKKYTISEIVKIESSNVFEKIENQDLLKFLIRDGYIRNDYYDYISYFFEGSLTLKDRDFVLSVKDDKPLEHEYTLTNIKEIMVNLSTIEFESKAILNYNLLDYMLLKNIKNEKFDCFMTNLADGSDISKEFILSFILLAQKQKIFIEEIIKKYRDVLSYILTEAQLTEDKQDEYFKIFFNNLSIKNLQKLDDGIMGEYIELKQKLSKLTPVDNEKFQTLIKVLNIKFHYIENPNDNPQLFNFIYENNLYMLNEKMINQIVLFKDDSCSKNDLKIAHLTTIKNSNTKKLVENIFDKLDFYIENIFLKIKTNNKESEDTILELLQNENVSLENKQAVIKIQEMKINDISIISSELWDYLFNENKVVAKWDNVLNYYEGHETLNSVLLDYFNKKENYVELSKNEMNNEKDFEKDLLENFSKMILQSTVLSNESYNYLVKGIWFRKFPSLIINNLSNEKIVILLENTKLDLTQDNIDSLKEYCPNKLIVLFENFEEDFVGRHQDFSLNYIDYIRVLKSSKFNIKEKISIIETMDLSLIDETEFANEIISIYIESDKTILKELFNKLFENSDINDSLELLINQIKYLSHEEISYSLNELQAPYPELTLKSYSSLKLKNSDINKKLLIALDRKDYISSIDINDKIIIVHRKRK